ncbi:hypothetical protein BT96DRAFT_849813 [Gymnopus androsaceus JB14]|uniref:Uncharacterized protein n=1 Tax=Gymnopus androsaceus JB14 TaxID=1447944 RepID=A0A6A4IGG4_9AGAR|nr:hypothetical protein BT96DRAFT_849813 [Gymnopus androsaceus JB14]
MDMDIDDGAASASQAPTQSSSSESGNVQGREIPVKVHIRRPERDSWVYMGRGIVTQEVTGHSSRIVVRALSTNKLLTQFGEGSDIQAEKRGNFVVIGLVEGSAVVSWSLNASNNSDTIRLLASIELACYKCKNALTDTRKAGKDRKKIDRIIKEDRRRRHRRRKDQEALIDAFAKSNIGSEPMPTDSAPSPPPAPAPS